MLIFGYCGEIFFFNFWMNFQHHQLSPVRVLFVLLYWSNQNSLLLWAVVKVSWHGLGSSLQRLGSVNSAMHYVLVNEVKGWRIRERRQRIVCLETGCLSSGNWGAGGNAGSLWSVGRCRGGTSVGRAGGRGALGCRVCRKSVSQGSGGEWGFKNLFGGKGRIIEWIN